MLRGFTDDGGTEWRVWQILPAPLDTQQPAADVMTRMSLNGTPFANGWLCFESASEKRRLAPIPEGWEFLDVPVLKELCARAQLVPMRRNRSESTGAAGAVSVV
jgi:hypothetical protein